MCVATPSTKAQVSGSAAYRSAKGHQKGTSESQQEKLGCSTFIW